MTVQQADMDKIRQLITNLDTCIMGKKQEIEWIVTTLLAEGHLLLEDVPGTGKTVLIKALSKSIDSTFRRVQCNPDLLPTDITGVSIFHPKDETFVFRPGPVMTNILLADEINRATTKTQSALLEAMEEGHVTVDGESHRLPRPFLVFATQNPIDFEGTYSLPEAQLDRFMMKISLGYPDQETEARLVSSQSVRHPLDTLAPVMSVQDVLQLQAAAKHVHMDEAVLEYGIAITRQTRQHSGVFLGASPRASLALIAAAKAYALVQGRDYVIPDDLKKLAYPVLAHRLMLRAEARMEGATEAKILQSILEQVAAPVRLGR
ncbi:MoxR family ATPase [Xylanibacillus composti]|uniref:ATPase n=1 Tax=Xylanibacillus composti TaxID=1572762 RepID=A0A8J4M386_9BACL|nr:MoxR family ATPase [Xylanibacillus composti]MDT9724480.1 MoxR family ATPase [Xylanibacillus composti]GIQ69742.1 ATPase [Xylanibacillus composti]